ncbi:MAG: hypothetical protein K2N27_00360 [Ruminococcus sp.]|nr:hypothetical protein [Ruminococcus sp.]
MTGTGTQTDPYIVSTWEDFKTAISTNGAYVELDADIDMNEEAPEGISKIDVNNVTLDGKNHAIKNLVANDGFLHSGTRNSNSYISDLKILNFVNRGTNNLIKLTNSVTIYFQHCTIIGINASTAKTITVDSGGSSTPASHIYFTATDEDGCLLNINICSGGFASGNIDITDSYVKLSGEKWTDSNSWHLNNSYVEGKISGSKFENCYNSVIDAECPDNSNFTVSNCSNLLVNTDKFTGTFSTETGIKKVKAEQLIDAEYLESIGFPIGVE